jgi:hypothetical protein
MTQVIEVIGVFIATGDRKHAGTQNILDAVLPRQDRVGR